MTLTGYPCIHIPQFLCSHLQMICIIKYHIKLVITFFSLENVTHICSLPSILIYSQPSLLSLTSVTINIKISNLSSIKIDYWPLAWRTPAAQWSPAAGLLWPGWWWSSWSGSAGVGYKPPTGWPWCSPRWRTWWRRPAPCPPAPPGSGPAGRRRRGASSRWCRWWRSWSPAGEAASRRKDPWRSR